MKTLVALLIAVCAITPSLAADDSQDEDESGLTAGWNGSHAFIRSKDDNFEVELGGRMHLDYRAYSGDFTPDPTFVLRRARLTIEGTFYHFIEFKVQPDFADEESTLLRDGFVNIHAKDSIQVMAGQFKAPFSQEEIQSSRYLDFVERSMLNNIVASRSPGVMVHGHTAHEVIQYAVSAQNDRGELQLNPAGRPDFFGQLRFKPWSQGALQGLQFGGAAVLGKREGERFFRGRTSSRSVVFSDRLDLNGDLRSYNLEGWWVYRSIKLQSEFITSSAQRLGLGQGGTDLSDAKAHGLYVQGTYILTGEKKQGDDAIVPKRGVHEGGPGAWEVGFRYQFLDIESSNRADAYDFKVDWWLNKFTRFQTNVSYETFRNPPAGGSDTSNIAVLTRMAVWF
jgi:phosphate-selective porin OprO/OprP